MTPEQTERENNALVTTLQTENAANLVKVQQVIDDETANISSGSLALLNAVKDSLTTLAGTQYANTQNWHDHRYG